jgi:hypothetical protein
MCLKRYSNLIVVAWCLVSKETIIIFYTFFNYDEAEAYCRQSAGTVIPGIEPRWDPWR